MPIRRAQRLTEFLAGLLTIPAARAAGIVSRKGFFVMPVPAGLQSSTRRPQAK